MAGQQQNNSSFYLLSDEEKEARGWNMPSFSKRMNKRLADFRGEKETTSESFLLRHNYRQSTQHMA